jgi:hypothetical protein
MLSLKEEEAKKYVYFMKVEIARKRKLPKNKQELRPDT